MKKSQIAKQERNAQLVKNLVEATKPLLLQQGYEDLTIREICANAGITTGMFYRHFVSKDDVLSFCFMQELEVLLASIDEKLEGLPLPEQLVGLHTEVLKINSRFGPASVYMFLNRKTESTSGSWQMRDMLKAKNTELIEKAVAAGFTLSPGRDPDNIYYDISTISKGCMADWYMTGFEDIADHAKNILSRLMPYLL